MKARFPAGRRCPYQLVLFITGLLALSLAAGCGYQLPDNTRSGPGGIHRLHISTVRNTTIYTELTFSLANYLVDQFSRSKEVRLTSRDIAEAVLQTEITSVGISGAARDAARTGSAARRVVVVVDATLRRTGSSEVLWAGRADGRRTYQVTGDQSTVEANLSRALDEISDEIAEKIHDLILQDF